MSYQEDRKILLKAGFTEAEKNRLSTLHRILTEKGRYQELIEYRRLHIVGWLVTTGRLTERVVETNEKLPRFCCRYRICTRRFQ